MTPARRRWLLVHRWVGLAAGVVLVVAGLSGSFLAFYPQIDGWLNPDWVRTTPGGQRLPMQQVLDAARPAMPLHFLHSVFPPADAQDVHHVWFTPSSTDQSRMWEVLVDPHSAKVLGQREAVPTTDFSRRNLANAVYTLHFQLLMGDFGATLVGFTGLFLLVSGISGAVLWWPRGRGWRAALRIKPGSHGIRLHYDLHRVAGVYSLVALLTVAASGVMLTFPGQTRPLVAAFSPLRDSAEPQALPATAPGDGALDADAVLARARSEAPGGEWRCLWLPGASGPAWRVSLREPQGVAWAGGPGELWFHPADGALLQQRRHADASGGEVFLAWLLPLHGGSAFGLAGRVLACLTGLVPLLMAVTGMVIWWRKRCARQRLEPRRSAHEAATR